MAGNSNALRAGPKAYDLLAAQPVSARGLSDPERSNIVVSAVADVDGGNHVLSLFGDAIWDFRPYFEQSNVADGQKYIPWPEDCPQELVDDCKAVLYAWFKRGLPGSKPPVAMGVCQAAIASAIPLMRWLAGLDVKRFDQVKPIHVANYVHHTKARLTRNAHSVYDSLRVLDFLWVFRNETSFPLASCPWGDSTLSRVSGLAKQAGKYDGRAGTGKTPIIPTEVQAKIFNYGEEILATAPAILSARAGTDWQLTPHQCRRTYARNIVESRMGRASLVFLKWQFKHSSMSMTQLYASNPMQDASLFDEVLEEMPASSSRSERLISRSRTSASCLASRWLRVAFPTRPLIFSARSG